MASCDAELYQCRLKNCARIERKHWLDEVPGWAWIVLATVGVATLAGGLLIGQRIEK